MHRRSMLKRILSAFTFSATLSFAQIATDGTIGPASTLSGPDFAIGADLGSIHGANLFHSFSQFNINTGESATFSGPASINNVLSRVTGGNASTIDGPLRSTIDGANVYLLNPAGVVMGPNAQIDVGGAFAVSTADHIRLGNNGRFDAANPAASLLNAEAVEAFGFVRDDPASVSINGSVITADPGRDITFVAGDITVDGASLASEGGDVSLIGIASSGEVTVDSSGGNGSPDVQAFSSFGNVEIRNNTAITTDGDGGGRFFVRGADVAITDSDVSARTLGVADGRGVNVAAAGQFRLVRSRIDTSTEHEGAAGDIGIIAASMVLDVRDAGIEAGLFADSRAEPIDTGVANISLTLDITHTFDGDLTTTLSSPQGTEIILFSDVGGSGANFESTTLTDEADTEISSGSAPFTGTFRPEESFAAFANEAASGTWTLSVADNAGGDDGTLDAWSLTIGGMAFSAGDLPQDISDTLPAASSEIVFDAPGLEIDLEGDLIPGVSGAISLSADTIDVLGDLQISAGATVAENVGTPTVTATSLSAGGFDAFTEIDDSGRVQFLEIFENVVFDGSLGDALSLRGPAYTISADLGELVGSNLFHSFARFELAAHETASFSGPGSVVNIVSRVTGNTISEIDGVIRSEIDGANVFLLNPAGIMFGPNGSVDISGALSVSTADYIGFDDGGRFDTSLAGTTNVTDGEPAAFGFVAAQPAPLAIDGTTITLTDDRRFTAVAGNIAITGGSISTGGGALALVSVASPGEVTAEIADPDAITDTQGFAALGIIDITAASMLDTSGEGGGRVLLRGHDVAVEDSTLSSRTTGDRDGGGVGIDAGGRFSLGRGVIDTRTARNGNGGAVAIAAGSVLLDARNAVGDVGIFVDSTAEPQDAGFANLTLTLDITHTWVSDLEATLASPGGAQVLLFSDVGDSDDDFTDTTFSDAATDSINDGSAPFTGTFRPDESFAALNGEVASGTWTLTIEDLFDGDDGTLNSWGLNIGGNAFAGTDIPADISNDIDPTTSSLVIDAPGLHVEAAAGIIPGRAGDITVTTPALEVFGDVALTAAATTSGNEGSIAIFADTITNNDVESVFRSDSNGGGRFIEVLHNIAFDGTTGETPILSGPDYEIRAEFGRIFGNNLFHSFSQFDLAADEIATFVDLNGISQIFARVTGGNGSLIDGSISLAASGVDLTLLNPNGILFSQNSNLSLTGALYVSTADYIRFEDNTQFSATEPGAPMSAGMPVAFGFTQQPGEILVDGSMISPNFQSGTAHFVGGDITVTNFAQVNALSLVSFADLGEVRIEDNGFSLPTGSQRGSITIDEGSEILSTIEESVITLNGDRVVIDNAAVDVRAGSISVEANELFMSNGARLINRTDAFTQSPSGATMVNAGIIEISGESDEGVSGIFATSDSAVVRAGDIIMNAGFLTVLGGARIEASTSGNSDAGNIHINVMETIILDGGSSGHMQATEISSNTSHSSSENGGNAGQIIINARNMQLIDGGAVVTTTFGSGDGGLITVDIDETLEIIGEFLFTEESSGFYSNAQVPDTGLLGDAGMIDIHANNLFMEDTGIIASNTDGRGDAGDIAIRVAESMVLDNSFVDTESELPGTIGNAGTIEIDARNLTLQNHSSVFNNTFSNGDAGSIAINVDNHVVLTGASTISSASRSAGNAGNAGRIEIGSRENPVLELRLSGDSAIDTEAFSAGGGQISIYAQALVYLLDSRITTSVADGFGFGGDIVIDPINVILNNSQILAQAFAGDGGAITIIADNFIQSNNSLVDATSARGNNGTIEIIAPETDINADLVPLLGDFLDAASWAIERCSARLGGSASSLTVAGLGGVPTGLDDLQSNLGLIGFDINMDDMESGAGVRRIRELPDIGAIEVVRDSGCQGCE